MKHIIITLGDPYGIGPEITFKALKRLDILNAQTDFTIIGEMASFKKFGSLQGNIKYIDIPSQYKEETQNKPSQRGGDISFKALDKAIDLALEDKNAALLTAPISKEAWAMAGVKYMGHTEVLRQKAGAPGALMMFKSGDIICALVTEHYAIKDLSQALTKERVINSAKILAQNLPQNSLIEISALNPHSGDGGKIGSEEKEIINPAIEELKKQGFKVEGAFPVDVLWSRHLKGKNKAILMMYHDAALTGLKIAAKEPVIHITAGLKFLRVSPTHGTAFDIAGKNIADENSMLAALKYALESK